MYVTIYLNALTTITGIYALRRHYVNRSDVVEKE